jgi:hypothetical protein
VCAVDEFYSMPLFLSIYYWRPEMFKTRLTLNFVILMFVICGLVFVVGCGNSKEVQAMTDLLKLFSDTVYEYSAADKVKKTELKATLDSFGSKWSNMEMEMDGRLTPNDLEKFDKQYKEIQTRYASLTGKS